MKKLLPILVLAAAVLSFVSCATTRTYVEGTEEYPTIPITTKLFSHDVYWSDYTLQMYKPKNNVHQVSVHGLGFKQGSAAQTGALYKNGKELYTVTFETNVDGVVAVLGNLDAAFADKESTIKISDSKKTYTYYVDHNSVDNIISATEPFSISIDREFKVIDQNGKISEMILNQNSGLSVIVNDEQYAVIDLLSNTQGIRINPYYSEDLSEEDKDFLVALMLASWKFDADFRNASDNSSSKFSLF